MNIQEEHSEGPRIEGDVVLDREYLIYNVLSSLDNLVLFSDISSGAFVNAVIIVLLVWRYFLDAAGNYTGLVIWCFEL